MVWSSERKWLKIPMPPTPRKLQSDKPGAKAKHLQSLLWICFLFLFFFNLLFSNFHTIYFSFTSHLASFFTSALPHFYYVIINMLLLLIFKFLDYSVSILPTSFLFIIIGSVVVSNFFCTNKKRDPIMLCRYVHWPRSCEPPTSASVTSKKIQINR
jgi:hypothetical protein